MDKYNISISESGVRVYVNHPNITIHGKASWDEINGVVRKAIKYKRTAIKRSRAEEFAAPRWTMSEQIKNLSVVE